MSDNNELSLLDEDLGDDDYDLGNEDEDALLADDYDQREDYISGEQEPVENQDDYQDYEEPAEDDILDLGVTDGLDDLDSEIQESADDSALSRKQPVISEPVSKLVRRKEEIPELTELKSDVSTANTNIQYEVETSAEEIKDHLESEEEDEGDGEGRGRFKSERPTVVSLKSGKTYGNIPDSLDNVITEESPSQTKQHKREGNQWRNRRGRGGPRGGGRGGGHFHAVRKQQQQQQQPPHFQGHMFLSGPGMARHPQLPPQQMMHPHHMPHQQHSHPPHPQPPQSVLQQHPSPQSMPSGHLPLQQPPQQQQPMHQPPHKILINPHFRGAVQPHPEARLIWDAEPPPQHTGDGLLPFPPRVFVDPPFGSGPPQGNYDPQFQPHEPVMFHNSPQHQQMPPQQPLNHPNHPNHQYYHNDVFLDHPSQPPHPQPLPPQHQQGHDEYWHDTAPHHHPPQGPPGRDTFYPPPDGPFNSPQFPGPGPAPQQDQPYHPPQGPPQPAVWEGVTSETMQISAGQVTVQPFPSTQGMFRPGPGLNPRFRQLPSRPMRNFVQQRPRFQGQMNGPRGRHPAGPVHHIPPQQPPQPVAAEVQPSSQQTQPQQPLQNFRSPPKRPAFDAVKNNVVPLTQSRFDPAPKRKKRMPDMSNLHEVKTVDTLPQQAEETQDENEDEETREYRKKIEEQKRLRERILQEKEARRKLAALEKQRELQKKDIDLQAGGDVTDVFASETDPPQGNAIATIVNRNTVEPHTIISTRPVVRNIVGEETHLMNTAQTTVVGMKQGGIRGRIVRGRGRGTGRCQIVVQKQQTVLVPQLQPQQQQPQPLQQKLQPQQKQIGVATGVAPGQRIVRTNMKPAAAQKANSPAVKRTIQGAQRVVQNAQRTVMLRGTNCTKLAPSQLNQQTQQQQQPARRVVQAQQNRIANAAAGRTVISSQNSSITVTAPDVSSLPHTKIVAVDNLAAATTDTQLRRMCQRVGAVEEIKMIPTQRRAVITFASPASAVTFQKRYQRKMVDLSLIQVKLLAS